ncbi:glutathione S-transferase [Echinococcus multilocularis]|uniref:glutathione transferase n=1 Tax=Echinococcus multilocularis TaxID=6211 RepID=Q27653_ECHMU|nr:glutathione transferase [Echinococcus multilocularis]CDS38088.1 glutathione S-transferase [Echinococcus multilocularis]
MAPTLAYWDIRGLAEQSRLLLKYLEVEYDDKRYKIGSAPTFDRSAWLSEKFSLGLDFPNLPYYIDGDFKLTQSGAILEYIADRHGMIPDCKKRRAVLHMLQCEVVDLRMAFTRTCYSPDFEKLKPGLFETLAQKLPNFEAYLGEKEWLTGDKINYPDFSLCELLNQLMKFEPTCLEKYPRLKAYLSRFENLPALRDYMASKEFKTCPCNGASAKWRGDC